VIGPAKELAQIGAAIGREFSHPLLAVVARKPEAELQTALDRLISAGLLLRQDGAPYATYSFKHVLVRDAAYSTLLREPRRALHARIAETLESHVAEISESQPELIARHYREADEVAKAVGHMPLSLRMRPGVELDNAAVVVMANANALAKIVLRLNVIIDTLGFP
jgi:predicted ATPase